MVALALLLSCGGGCDRAGPDGAGRDTADPGPDTAAPDPDADGDGHDATSMGGDDCDDGDPSAYPGAEEWCDPVDHDCDGQPFAPGVCAKRQDGDAVMGVALGGTLVVPHSAQSGELVADVTGDAVDDVIVGCVDCIDGGYSGYLLFSGADLPRRAEDADVYAHAWTDGYVLGTGNRLSDGGDFDGDGQNEAWMGAWYARFGTYMHEGPVPLDGTSELLGYAAEISCGLGLASPDGWTEHPAAGDLDGDGETELAWTVSGSYPDDAANRPGLYVQGLQAGELQWDCRTVFLYGVGIADGIGGGYLTMVPGDLDGDGAEDLVVGTGDDSWVILGPDLVIADGLTVDAVATWQWVGEFDSGDDSDWQVPPCAGRPGDVDQDGYDDWLLCAYGARLDEAYAGEVFFVPGGLTLAGGAHQTTETAGSYRLPDTIGLLSVAASDLDGDAARELVIIDHDAVRIVRGSTSFPALHTSPDEALLLRDAGVQGAYWYLMDGGRDVTGDGLEDVLFLNFEEDAPYRIGVYTGWEIPWDDASLWTDTGS